MNTVDLGEPPARQQAPSRSLSGPDESGPEPAASIDQLAFGVDKAVDITASLIRADGELKRELLQEAWVAALELAPEFDRSVGVSFIDYLRSRLRWRLRTYLREEWRRNRSSKLMPLENVRAGSRRFDPAAVSEPDLRSAIRRLSPRQRSVVAAKYVEGRRTVEIATSLGISRQSVAKLLRRAHESLREALSE